MTIFDDVEVTAESIPVILALVKAISAIVNAKEDASKELDALETAAEAVKKRADQLKFPSESES